MKHVHSEQKIQRLETSFLAIQEDIQFSVESYQHNHFPFTLVFSYVTEMVYINFLCIIAVKHVSSMV